MSEPRFRSGLVSIVGRPNVGKSTIINALIGEPIAITAPLPQTTRTTLQGVLTTAEMQAVLWDTPGIHRSDSLINRRMMRAVRDALRERDLVLFVADSTRKPGVEDEEALSALAPGVRAVLLANKIDRLSDKRLLLPLIEWYGARRTFTDSVPVSARTKEGLDEVKRLIHDALRPGERLYPNDFLTDQPMRFIAAEIIREQILRTAQQEVPHAAAVKIDEWDESRQVVHIGATIYVERPGQRVILIGARGATLKSIGTAARIAIEKWLNRKVFLSLFVRVQPNWREDSAFLDSLDWRNVRGTDVAETSELNDVESERKP